MFSKHRVLWSLVIVNSTLLLANALIRFHNMEQGQPFSDDHSPIEMPFHFDLVGMTLLRDTVRFQTDRKNISRLEWNTLSYHPFVIHIGDERRAYQVALFHELHCLHVMEEAFIRGEYHGLNAHHIRHCENYLRQSFLCMADNSIERGDFSTTWTSEDRNMGTKICKDWMGVSSAVMINLNGWLAENKTENI
ncbi:hypothetical protein CPC08DRAFT_694709 [Agrocybe pediades]|nr:hypothetical protein CPC08DRAFT_694709 [Agrocybe pediades]